jgi:hypothetical protein
LASSGHVLTDQEMAAVIGDDSTYCVVQGHCTDPKTGSYVLDNTSYPACLMCGGDDKAARSFCCSSTNPASTCNANGGGAACSGSTIYYALNFQNATDTCGPTCTAVQRFDDSKRPCAVVNATGTGACAAQQSPGGSD